MNLYIRINIEEVMLFIWINWACIYEHTYSMNTANSREQQGEVFGFL
jgi:hypothetical protein